MGSNEAAPPAVSAWSESDTSSEPSTDTSPEPQAPPSPPPRSCVFEALLCAQLHCEKPARDVVKTHDCGCGRRELRNSACITQWIAAEEARDAAAKQGAESHTRVNLRKSSPDIWTGSSCDYRIHFCKEHGQKSDFLEVMRRKESIPQAFMPWYGPFPGEYPAESTVESAWVDLWIETIWSSEVSELMGTGA